jgi:mono/diheme cytochrome c family protein
VRTILLALMIVTPAVAQCTVRKVVTAPVVHAQHVVVVDTHRRIVDHHHERIVLVPVEVHRDNYSSIDKDNILIDAAVGRMIRLQQEGKVPTLSGPAPEAKRPVSERPPAGPVSTGPAVAGAYQNDKLFAVVNNNCAKCHGPESKLTKLVTADGKLADVSLGKVWESFGRTNIGNMPKAPGKALANEDVELFVEWAENARK